MSERATYTNTQRDRARERKKRNQSCQPVVADTKCHKSDRHHQRRRRRQRPRYLGGIFSVPGETTEAGNNKRVVRHTDKVRYDTRTPCERRLLFRVAETSRDLVRKGSLVEFYRAWYGDNPIGMSP